jgi:hypothetical protein
LPATVTRPGFSRVLELPMVTPRRMQILTIIM